MEVLKSPCNQCYITTNHKVLFCKDIKGFFEQDGKILQSREYLTVECLGCNEVSFLQKIINHDQLDDNGQPFEEIFHFPDLIIEEEEEKFNRLSYSDLKHCPIIVLNLYKEVVKSFRSNAAILSGIGLRTLVEAVCIDQNIAGKNLKEKISEMHKQGLISKSEEPILDKLRLIGNISAHEIKSLSMEKLAYALDIINHILKSIYILPKLNTDLEL